ncbi:hypothetical protein Athai_11910 [Actinocatenispora thailandica]|uniref:Uncharacterized protein n=1 Tax=Actinocatenispora thailandica TaxID=227318 RepID=A0A7R7DL90_9ACTN|nr:hypothetical protein Athai_11910 [Actinocatenispora thailandica]
MAAQYGSNRFFMRSASRRTVVVSSPGRVDVLPRQGETRRFRGGGVEQRVHEAADVQLGIAAV